LRLGGGFPHPSYMIVEGDNGSGKTALVQQIIYGALSEGLSSLVITTERSVKEFLADAAEIRMDMSDYFIEGSLRIYTANLRSLRWAGLTNSKILDILSNFFEEHSADYDLMVVDSLTHLIHGVWLGKVLNFFKDLRFLVRRGNTLILTLHPNILPGDMRAKVVGISDVYVSLSNVDIGGRTYKMLNLVKMKGFNAGADPSIIFDVDPALGIKVVPMKATKA
jgi:flagellar protein FlaH